ncbi:dihydrodipicolinate synthase family protein [Nocardiopsis dassonvillei]|uniref:Dihydrodipicolinate synthetase n=1 Tax=Nocardiopsis dassonvillei (strain ATCC 23218 / DSM 43111 / CIP 107115 / JCM 7437 / KCTC 9190 / NBRC 14626 / NCTC 10488 / NRRL B-5397 / IMRU 509) TaxID=446468 RepID=D7B664_NOCDD|nr:dihydrodipicolinate synthase family protein [Nocardiopsis dassonvillei]ADH67329.1 dihydrodipicolinate synthetase [Nocardiopsis dassonvillei subsp. dassonvillei DSM 43111]APC35544.1 dihydrodipicolinate synthase family protein [Nocardiopsis dassonvillei]NKY77332.1 dihydrodipicolinate synthase family protein [Nocardiopsis dassonvillei]VEI87458.1 dihydrodipicolinate synthase [Nocardiopsis dassonvillei]
MFTGLSAFPLTPLDDDRFDERAYAGLVTRLAEAGVDSIGALGSTGSYAYLDREERRRAARTAVQHADGTPVVVGIGALRTSQVQALAQDAQQAGASAVLLAPVSYQPLTDEDVFALYATVAAELSVPLVVYDNPGTTRFTFSTGLYARVAALPAVAAIKIPPVPADPVAARERVAAVRAALPDHVSVGVSGDGVAATGLNAGCRAWFSVVGGTLPAAALPLVRAALGGDAEGAAAESERLRPLWELFASHGSLRVVAAIAEHLGLVAPRCLPRPILGLPAAERERVARVVEQLGLA